MEQGHSEVAEARRQAVDATSGKYGDCFEPLRLAALRASSGLKLPDCCTLDTALSTRSTLATFDVFLATAARERNVDVAPPTSPR